MWASESVSARRATLPGKSDQSSGPSEGRRDWDSLQPALVFVDCMLLLGGANCKMRVVLGVSVSAGCWARSVLNGMPWTGAFLSTRKETQPQIGLDSLTRGVCPSSAASSATHSWQCGKTPTSREVKDCSCLTRAPKAPVTMNSLPTSRCISCAMRVVLSPSVLASRRTPSISEAAQSLQAVGALERGVFDTPSARGRSCKLVLSLEAHRIKKGVGWAALRVSVRGLTLVGFEVWSAPRLTPGREGFRETAPAPT